MSDSGGNEALRRWIGGEDNMVIYDWFSNEKEEEVEWVESGGDILSKIRQEFGLIEIMTWTKTEDYLKMKLTCQLFTGWFFSPTWTV